MNTGEGARKRARKSRGTGLRTTTGCLTCRKRHKKCDEKRPVCGPCSISDRRCLFPQNSDAASTLASGVSGGNYRQTESRHEQAASSPIPAATQQPDVVANSYGSQAVPPTGEEQLTVQCEHEQAFICSPRSIASGTWSANFASIRWLDLLASDALQADSNHPLATGLLPPDEQTRGGEQTRGAEQQPPQTTSVFVHVSPALLNGQAQLPENLDPELERTAWQSGGDVILSAHEAMLFRYFADRCASWLDLFDPHKLFSSYAIRLAIRNAGLMKAILALSSKHQCSGIDAAARQLRRDIDGDYEDGEWIRYYYETLQYVRETLKYPSYSHSEELLATALIISVYEMLDESDGSGNWQRHLKGIFWIQRSQDVDGGCGGLRQSVWWAWLRQDVWAAFRESRACLSFWVPKKAIHELDQNELADMAIYILSQAINYRASVQAATSHNPVDKTKLTKQRSTLVSMMEQWKAHLGEGYKVLPTPKAAAGQVFSPLWIHPPRFGAALQAYSFAQILLTLHTVETLSTGFHGYLKMQRTLSEAVNTICGIALQLKDESCQILSAQCLYGAGLCVTDGEQRAKIISLMEECEARVCWPPMAMWRKDLHKDWERVDADDYNSTRDD
ncbi:Putative Zn(II)2Cys6 transcription factor [Beauveria bassiana ARSEF 2860]|uniref:Putative Zn(II)2Cys6 transcription factor n=1 Tax=Beauveria bassiana (strain ARSEF 2860) TaxID=655819 RepID=J5JKE8_BEAB2|nr:Putative Zn(II)2Cys6 transcription factor [Beauveria bassiana ARSEF 2860]EJP63711.1 Putative Zn(II)2Cys6 transcription factor [Beauveria bassiana ARSEF 2860]